MKKQDFKVQDAKLLTQLYEVGEKLPVNYLHYLIGYGEAMVNMNSEKKDEDRAD